MQTIFRNQTHSFIRLNQSEIKSIEKPDHREKKRDTISTNPFFFFKTIANYNKKKKYHKKNLQCDEALSKSDPVIQNTNQKKKIRGIITLATRTNSLSYIYIPHKDPKEDEKP